MLCLQSRASVLLPAIVTRGTGEWAMPHALSVLKTRGVGMEFRIHASLIQHRHSCQVTRGTVAAVQVIGWSMVRAVSPVLLEGSAPMEWSIHAQSTCFHLQARLALPIAPVSLDFLVLMVGFVRSVL